MQPVTNVSFDRPERQTLERAVVWGALAEDARESVLKRVSQKDATGIAHKALSDAKDVVMKIQAKARQDLDLFRPAAEQAPTSAPEGSLIANPRQAAQVIVEAREAALRDTVEVLELLDAALSMATPAYHDPEDV